MKLYNNIAIRVAGIVNIKQLDQFIMTQQINNHMFFELSGIIGQQDGKEYMRSRLIDQEICIYDCSEEQEIIICRGVITGADIIVTGDVYRILLKGASASVLLDRKKNKRSFQNIEKTYGDIFMELCESGEEFLFSSNRSERLGMPAIQYNETDWEFLLRMAGRLHAVVIPNALTERNSIFLGEPEGKKYELSVENSEFHIQENDNIKKHTYKITEHNHMQLGDKVSINNREWTVIEKYISIQNSQMKKNYTLGILREWKLSQIKNPYLKGITLRGKVIKRKNEMVKLWLDIDEKQNYREAFWFPYVPETGNLMYTIPEEGAEAALYFPDGDEKNGLVTHCFHKKNTNSIRRDHRIKELRIPRNKRLRFYPETMEFSSKKRENMNALKMGERLGVQFASNSPIQLIAEGDINIHSGLSTSFIAQNQIAVEQSGNKNSIHMYGDQIIFQATRYYTSSASHNNVKSKNTYLSNQSFPALYGNFLGMMNQGECEDIYGKMLGGLPVLGSAVGEMKLNNQIGLRIQRHI